MKPTIAFIPGWGFNANIWNTIAAQLPNFHHVFLDYPELPHHEDELTFLSEYLFKQLPPQTILVGWSLGGLLAMHLAAQRVNHFKKICCITTSPFFAEATGWAGISKTIIESFQQQLAKNEIDLYSHFRRQVFFPTPTIRSREQYYWRLNKAQAKRYLQLLFNTDLRSIQLPQLSSLHLFGAKDKILPKNVAEHLMENIYAHNSYIFPHAGHALFLDNASHFFQIFYDFISGNP